MKVTRTEKTKNKREKRKYTYLVLLFMGKQEYEKKRLHAIPGKIENVKVTKAEKIYRKKRNLRDNRKQKVLPL